MRRVSSYHFTTNLPDRIIPRCIMQLLLHLKSDLRMRAEVASGVLNHFPLEGVISTQFGRLFPE